MNIFGEYINKQALKKLREYFVSGSHKNVEKSDMEVCGDVLPFSKADDVFVKPKQKPLKGLLSFWSSIFYKT
jgi:hypothetical protein